MKFNLWKGAVFLNNSNILTKQFLVSPAAGKRIIARSFLYMPSIIEALENKTIVIVAGTTNGYVAEEILNKINQSSEFSKKKFFRGVTLPHNYKAADTGSLGGESQFQGDVVIVNGTWDKGKTIYDIADKLNTGDIIIKGANALNLESKQAAIYIGHPTAGTMGVALQAVLGKRVELYLPVGLEKRIFGDINKIAQKLNAPNASGLRYLPVNGNIITELDAIKLMTGADAELVASGGVCGAEGSCWFAVSGTEDQLDKVSSLLKSISEEPNFEL